VVNALEVLRPSPDKPAHQPRGALVLVPGHGLAVLSALARRRRRRFLRRGPLCLVVRLRLLPQGPVERRVSKAFHEAQGGRASLLASAGGRREEGGRPTRARLRGSAVVCCAISSLAVGSAEAAGAASAPGLEMPGMLNSISSVSSSGPCTPPATGASSGCHITTGGAWRLCCEGTDGAACACTAPAFTLALVGRTSSSVYVGSSSRRTSSSVYVGSSSRTRAALRWAWGTRAAAGAGAAGVGDDRGCETNDSASAAFRWLIHFSTSAATPRHVMRMRVSEGVRGRVWACEGVDGWACVERANPNCRVGQGLVAQGVVRCIPLTSFLKLVLLSPELSGVTPASAHLAWGGLVGRG
jgi:hypothetical protein